MKKRDGKERGAEGINSLPNRRAEESDTDVSLVSFSGVQSNPTADLHLASYPWTLAVQLCPYHLDFSPARYLLPLHASMLPPYLRYLGLMSFSLVAKAPEG